MFTAMTTDRTERVHLPCTPEGRLPGDCRRVKKFIPAWQPAWAA